MEKMWQPIKNYLFGRNLVAHDMEKIYKERIAIDQIGSLGWLYDACQDTIIGKPGIASKSQRKTLNEPIKCIIYKGRTAETQNLLQMVGLNRSLRLSILLKMILPTGIASIINYPRAIDKYTRFLYFYWETSMESCRDDMMKRKTWRNLPASETSATHIITDIVWGIHAVVVLQLPPNQEVQIDQSLEQVRHYLTNYNSHFATPPYEKGLLDQIISTTVYSNIPDLTKLTKLDDICQTISRMGKSITEHRPLKYTVSLIGSSYAKQTGNNTENDHGDESTIDNFENALLQQSSEMRVLQLRLDHELPELLQDKLQARLNTARQSFSQIKQLYDNQIQQIRDLIILVRKDRGDLNPINNILHSDVQATIEESFYRLITSLDALTSKGNLIKHLQNNGIEYCDVSKHGIDRECNEQLVNDMLLKNDVNKVIFCSNDNLKQNSEEQWNALYSQMIDERNKNSQLNLIYADFTYSTWCLGQMIILTTNQQTIHSGQSNSTESFRRSQKKQAPLAPSTSPSSSFPEYINILLLGESGVGKSTFINAFANYLRFDTLEQAQSGKPIVIIPVSFLITVNDDFDEQLVKFGDTDPNEDHSKSGRSVTQQCRSYVFDISHDKKLRIIDTPGFGDTRGDNQDEINMEMIFSFINNLSHLNGICFLFKPNVGQLNSFLFPCFTQLFQCFGENIRDRFMFCFTNARSTFFAPGDTRPLLTSFFKTFPVKNIPLEKKNTFCFDSESFRYLVALQKAIKFNESDKEEFETSWVRSAEESQRLRAFLCEELHPYRKGIEWQSIKDAQFQINFMIRPMLEAMRNILRNILLYQFNATIELKAIYVGQPTVICYSCERAMGKFGDCWILLDHLHPLSHTCGSNQQRSIEYRLEYIFHNSKTNESKDILLQQRNSLRETCMKFAVFLMKTQSRQDDPFLSGVIRMIEEEQDICHRQNQNKFNQHLVAELEKVKNEYEHFFNKTYSDNGNGELSSIYDLIKSVDEIQMIKEQTDAIRKYQQLLVSSNETNFSDQRTAL